MIEKNNHNNTKVLDIMEIVARNVITDDTFKPNENESELTASSALYILLKELNFNLLRLRG